MSTPTANATRRRILLIEDETALAREISETLQACDLAVEIAATFEAGLAAARRGEAAVLVVDRMLNGGQDGLSLVETIRGEGDRTPVLFISALSAVDDRIRGLNAGGDDYLIKPFALSELVARVEALARRGEPAPATRLRIGALEIDFVEREAWCDEARVDLAPREFKLLAYFMRRPGQLVTRAMLLQDIWNYKFQPQTNVVDVHIGNLRRKLGEGRRYIVSLRAEGFKLDADA